MRNPTKLVSVVVPIYNLQSYLHACVESIRGQSYSNLEIILVDDGSTDDSGTICDDAAVQDSRIRVIHKTNGGLSDARNAGIKVSHGQYLAFVDGDDYIHKDFIRVLLDNSLKYNADISVCTYMKVYEDGEPQRAMKDKEFAEFTNVEAMRDLLSSHGLCDVMTWNKLYKRELFVGTGITFPVGKIHEDNFTTYKLFYFSQKVVFADKALYYYLQRGTSIMGNAYSQRNLHMVEACDEMIRWIKDKQIPLREEAVAFRFWMTQYLVTKMGDSVVVGKKDWQELVEWVRTNRNELLRNKYLGLSQKLAVSAMLLGRSCFIVARQTTRLPQRPHMPRLSFSFNANSLHVILWLARAIQARARHNAVVFIMGTPEHNNIGDQAIAWAQHEFVQRRVAHVTIISIPLYKFEQMSDEVLKLLIKRNDTICGHGGGNMGDVYVVEEDCRRRLIKLFPDNRIVVFPQTIHFTDTETGRMELEKSKKVYKKHQSLHLIAREQTSYNIMRSTFPSNDVILTPDIVLSMDRSKRSQPRKGLLLCLRSDVEGKLSDNDKAVIGGLAAKSFKVVRFTDTISKTKYFHRLPKRWIVAAKLREFSGAELVITDRLHGMVFSAITGTPCIALANFNHKVAGTYKWIGHLPYIRFCDDIQNLEDILKQLDLAKTYRYDPAHFDAYWKKIVSCVVDHEK